ncbi:hypothetical protein OE766_24225 [Pararhizobium sp. YC-54]|uniref:hypothetical protein n=1 Tax=Pararhizobium sp. YC-54 TaxID=2986920 RepID=UPI0021F786D1|nr:hypothetical protein [Pararhizobium sp. YC-54]MCW0001333.1 hypothetical protein [Pararhizobium sp. YC-54]
MDKISELAERYPHLTFGNLRFGIECGDGWADIIHAFLATAEEVTAAGGGTLHLLQIKEKMGGLRIYYRMADTPQKSWMGIDEAYYLAEARSFHVCEHCGRLGLLTYNGLLYATRCAEHAAELEAELVSPGPCMKIVVAGAVEPYDPDADPFISTLSD